MAKVDAMLRQVEEFNKQHGLVPGAMERYMQENLSPAERAAVERQVKQAIREVYEEGERAVESMRAASRPLRKFRPKLII